MNNGLIYNLLNTIIRKEKEGLTFTPEQYTELLQMCSWEKANADYSYFEMNQVITDSLKSLKTESPVSITSGEGNVPTSPEYWHATNAYHSNATYSLIPIDIVTDVEYKEKSFSDLERPTEVYPILKIVNDKIIVNPDTITSIEFEYLKKPDEPFFDYYIDADDNIIYLQPGEVYTLKVDEEYRNGTTGAGTDVTSISVELSFPEGERVQVLYMILEKMGVSLNEADALQYGIAREQKEEAQ